MSVQLEFDLEVDLCDELETFNRLLRLGDFCMAEKYFDQNLKAELTNPWVFIQYAEMLIEKGDYKSVQQLNPETVFGQVRSFGSEDSLDALDLLELNWKLLNCIALTYCQHELQPILDEVTRLSGFLPAPRNMGSTEVKILCLAMRLLGLVGRSSILKAVAVPESIKDWANWSIVYEQLKAQGRIWDFRDLFIAAHMGFGTAAANAQFFGSEDVLKTLLSDWVTTEEDQTTQLALLDILTFMVEDAGSFTESQPFAGKCLRAASAIAESIMDSYPDSMQTRPFLRWILANGTTQTRGVDSVPLSFDYLRKFCGLLETAPETGIPFYLPINQEQPGWQPAYLQTPAIMRHLEIVLKPSRDLDDYRTEAQCLGELIIRVSDPTSLFQELSHLQKEKQGNVQGHLSASFSQYLLATNATSRAELFTVLEGFGSFKDPSKLIFPSKAWARDILLRALNPTGSSTLAYSTNAAELFYYGLSSKYKTWIQHYAKSLDDQKSQQNKD